MNSAVTITLSFLLSFLTGYIVIPQIIKVSLKKNLYDMPNQRKVHIVPIPRLGGVSFLPVILMSAGFTIAACCMLHMEIFRGDRLALFTRYLLLIVGTTLLFLLGMMDDLVGVGYKSKFLAQILSASLFPLSNLWIDNLWGLFGIHELTPWIGIPLTIFMVVYITNAINLIDGIDGLSSGLCWIAFFALGCASAIKHQFIFNTLCFSSLGVLSVFWYINVFGNAEKGKKLFMGDTGSLTLGYLLSFLLIYMTKESTHYFPRGMIMMGFSTVLLPMMDIVRVVFSRFRRHDPLFLPDKNHIHHKLLRTGLRVRHVLTILLSISALYIVIAVVGVIIGLNYNIILLIEIGIWICVQVTINHFIHKHEGDKTKIMEQIAFGHPEKVKDLEIDQI